MSDDLQTNNKMYNIEYRTFNKLNIMTDSYIEAVAMGIKDITNLLNVNIISRIRIFCNDNDIICHINDGEAVEQKNDIVQYVYDKPLTYKVKNNYILLNPKNEKIWEMCKKLSLHACGQLFYSEYFYKLHSNATYKQSKHSKILQPTGWDIQEVTFEKYMYLLECLLEYDRLLESYNSAYRNVEITKHEISLLPCVIRYKECKKQLDAYTTELEDSQKRLTYAQKVESGDYDNIGVLKFAKKEQHAKRINVKSDYQRKLQVSLTELIRFCTESLELAEYKMQSNRDYQTLNAKLTSQKETSRLALKKCTNYRRKFMEFRVAPKTAAWKYGNHYGAIQWFKSKTIETIKMYDKVTFDYSTIELKLH